MVEVEMIAGSEQIYRNRTNRVSGVLLQFMLAGVWILTDPLELRGELPEGQGFGMLGALVVAISLGVAAVVSMAVWWYPGVEVSNARIVIRNPLKTTAIPFEQIVDIDSSSSYVRIMTSSRAYRCAGLENSLGMAILQSGTSSTGRLIRAVPLSRQPMEMEVISRWRRLSGPEILVGVCWLVVAAVSDVSKLQ